MDESRKVRESARIELPTPPIPSADIADEATLRRFLDAVGVAYLALAQDCAEREYAQALQPQAQELGPYEDRLRAYLADGRIARVVAEWGEKTQDALMRRELRVLGHRGLFARVENREMVELVDRIRRRMSSFRPEIDGVPVPLSVRSRSLREDRDRGDREEAYAALGPLHEELSADVRRLMTLRNQSAQTLGYPDAASLLLSLSDLPTDRCVALVEAVEERTREPHRASLDRLRAAAGSGVDSELRPWDVSYAMERIQSEAGVHFPKRAAAPHLDRTWSEMGFDTDALPIRIRDAEIPYRGLCYRFYRPREARILLSPTGGSPYLRTMFHEFGHGVLSVLEDEASPVLLGSSEGPFGEGIAETFAGVLYLPGWHVRYAERSSGDAERAVNALLLERLHRLRHVALRFSFEIRAYAALAADPQADLDALALDTERRFLQINPQPGPFWAAWPGLTTHSVYWQNYAVGACIADEIWRTLAARTGDDPVGNAETGRLLSEQLLRPAPRDPWPLRVEQFLGHPLSAESLRLPT